jgi:hypothetical protein
MKVGWLTGRQLLFHDHCQINWLMLSERIVRLSCIVVREDLILR